PGYSGPERGTWKWVAPAFGRVSHCPFVTRILINGRQIVQGIYIREHSETMQVLTELLPVLRYGIARVNIVVYRTDSVTLALRSISEENELLYSAEFGGYLGDEAEEQLMLHFPLVHYRRTLLAH